MTINDISLLQNMSAKSIGLKSLVISQFGFKSIFWLILDLTSGLLLAKVILFNSKIITSMKGLHFLGS